MLLLAAVHANSSFKALLYSLHLFIYVIDDTPLYGHMVCIFTLILMNHYAIIDLLLRKFTSIENQTIL